MKWQQKCVLTSLPFGTNKQIIWEKTLPWFSIYIIKELWHTFKIPNLYILNVLMDEVKITQGLKDWVEKKKLNMPSSKDDIKREPDSAVLYFHLQCH